MRPILFHIGSYGVHSYGVMLMLAIVLSVWRAYGAAQSRKSRDSSYPISPDDVLDVTIWIVAGIVIGARLLFVAVDWGDYSGHIAEIFQVWNGGLSFHGGLIGVIIALVLFAMRRKIPFLALADLIAPSAMLGYAIGRIGCFLNGCCYGAPTNLPWAVRFDDDGIWTVPSHPTQLYSTLISLVFFGILVWMERRGKFPGQISFFYILFSAVERFIMEIWRADVTSSGGAFGLTEVQWLCVAMAIVAVIALAILRRRAANATNSPALHAARL